MAAPPRFRSQNHSAIAILFAHRRGFRLCARGATVRRNKMANSTRWLLSFRPRPRRAARLVAPYPAAPYADPRQAAAMNGGASPCRGRCIIVQRPRPRGTGDPLSRHAPPDRWVAKSRAAGLAPARSADRVADLGIKARLGPAADSHHNPAPPCPREIRSAARPN